MPDEIEPKKKNNTDKHYARGLFETDIEQTKKVVKINSKNTATKIFDNIDIEAAKVILSKIKAKILGATSAGKVLGIVAANAAELSKALKAVRDAGGGYRKNSAVDISYPINELAKFLDVIKTYQIAKKRAAEGKETNWPIVSTFGNKDRYGAWRNNPDFQE